MKHPDKETPSAGAKVIAALALMPVVAAWVGGECYLLNYALREQSEHGWIAWVPVISIGLLGLIVGTLAWSGLNTSPDKGKPWSDEEI